MENLRHTFDTELVIEPPNQSPITIQATGLEGRHGKFIVPTYDKLVGQAMVNYGEYSYLEFELFEDVIKPHFIVGEVGANIGAHTVGLSKLVPNGKVIAFEPQLLCYTFLMANMALNNIQNVDVYQLGLGNKEETMIAPALIWNDSYAKNGMNLMHYAGVHLLPDTEESKLERVLVTRGDTLFTDGLDFLKVDVEGMEKKVLEGLTATIKKYNPIIYVENDKLEKSTELIEYCWSLGYTLHWHIPPLFNPNNYFGNSKNTWTNIHSFNMIGFKNAKINLPLVTLVHPFDLSARKGHFT